MRPTYKQRCIRCKKNMVITTGANRFPVCYDCQKKELQGEITDPVMKAMFDVPEEFYVQNTFVRDIKVSYLKFGSLSEKQIEAFKKAIERLKEQKEQ